MDTHYPPESRWFNLKTVLLVTIVLAIAVVSLAVNLSNRPAKVVRSGSSGTYTDQKGVIGSEQWELFPTPSGATQMFDDQLQQSRAYQEFSPCFDDRGRRIGERAAMWMHSPTPTKAFWRIIWTERNSESSQLYWTEADTLEVARDLETKSGAKWPLCRTSNWLGVIGEPARP
ncbi:MAG TPA: hypothetical protein VGQ39_09920 [Pyrinomonadaceae bacterium]|jgi:hypothetical protein|nr:hypothetical protein [Pyrinomonadaceae bacterium]